MTNTNKESLMDKYAMRKLSSIELGQLQELIDNDPKLQVELDMRRDIADGVTLTGNRQLRSMLEKVHNEVVGPSGKETGGWKQWVIVGIITSIAALVGYQLLVKSGSEPQQPVMQYASYYTPIESTSRGETATGDNQEQQYLEAYTRGDYAAVISILSPTLQEAPNEQRLVIAIAALEVGEYELAAAQLQKITVSDDFYYVDHAKWYQALLYLELGDAAAAQTLLRSLAQDSNADHSQDARQLLESLK